MIPIEPAEQFGRLVELAKDQPEYQTLPVRLSGDRQEIMTLWRFTAEERVAIADGANLGLRVLTFGQPFQPVCLAVENTEGWQAFYD